MWNPINDHTIGKGRRYILTGIDAIRPFMLHDRLLSLVLLEYYTRLDFKGRSEYSPILR